MSLINDALKKAQKQRTGEAPSLASMPSIGGEAPQRIAKRSKPAGFNALLIRLGLGAVGLAVLVIGGVVLLHRKSANTPVATASTSPAALAASPAKPATPPPATTEPASSAFVLPIAVPAAPAPAPAPSVAVVAAAPLPVEPKVSTGQTPGSQQGTTVQPPPAAAKPAGPPPKLAGKAIDYIENLRIAGIRASATDSKVLMNDRVYRIGDIVEHEMNLKLVGITSSSLTFENEEGARYTRTF